MSLPLKLPTAFATGELGVEPAKWTPAPLKRASHVYYVGRKGEGAELECSCMLYEHVWWDGDTPKVVSDDLYPDNATCPFDALRAYCEQILDRGGWVMIACDDSGGVGQGGEEADYQSSFLLTDQIARGRLVFAGTGGDFPWRALQVLRPMATVTVAEAQNGPA
jgi:hypothetical protein